MRRIAALLILVGSLFLVAVPQALPVNDPFVPAENCAPANAQAVGHPAFSNQSDNPQGANPPFSSNNPGQSTGAKAALHTQALVHCPGAQI